MTTEEAIKVFGEVMRSKRLRQKQIREAEQQLSVALATYVRTMAQELIAMAAEGPDVDPR